MTIIDILTIPEIPNRGCYRTYQLQHLDVRNFCNGIVNYIIVIVNRFSAILIGWPDVPFYIGKFRISKVCPSAPTKAFGKLNCPVFQYNISHFPTHKKYAKKTTTASLRRGDNAREYDMLQR